MRRWLWIVLLLVMLVGCSSSDPVHDGRVGEKRADMRPDLIDPTVKYRDAYVCILPATIASCVLPDAGQGKMYCGGCNCAGPNPVAACNASTGDCRFFATGCYPKSHTLCDTSAPDNILALCGKCFFAEAGIPASCNRLNDAGI